MKSEKNTNVKSELTAEDWAAIRRSEKEIERGECIELNEAIKLFKNKYPGLQI